MSKTQGTTSRSLYSLKKKYISMQVCASCIDTLCDVRINLADCPAISLVFVCIHNFNLRCTDIFKIFFGQDIILLNINEADGNLGKP